MMEHLSEYFRTQSSAASLQVFVLNLCLAAACCWLLSRFFVRFGRTLSNRARFARNFVLLGVTTMLIVTVVKSSLALSLGLVGALSIIRFRGAIKEPEELSYLFISIAIGLGFGANQAVVTVLGLALLLLCLGLSSSKAGKQLPEGGLCLGVSSADPEQAGLEKIVAVLKEGLPEVHLRRFDTRKDQVEATFKVEAEFESLERVRKNLHALSSSVQVSFLDNEELF